jgi:hypothetical protein
MTISPLPLAFALALLAVSSCREAASPPPPPPAPEGLVSCTRDSDCQAPACGPCASGAPITAADMTMECVVNPCRGFVGDGGEQRHFPAPGAICSAGHTCVVR